ncbi:MAG: hypothetical protein KAQ94_08635 [Arcobacteraceae bacterium]|nr:hypothetical protein [Arcobacteraceae bacterium]
MASDLSNLILNGLSDTLESLLAKKAKLEQTTQTHPSDLKGQCIKVDTTFEFNNITSNWSFFIPALSASHIFNLMMGEDIEPVDEVDEDILDALNEVVSNISGGLTTAINGSEFDDLGSVKFSIAGNEIVDGSEYAVSETLFRILISLEDKEVLFFINFDEPIMPYINIIALSEVTQVEEISTQEEEEDLEEEKETSSQEDADNLEEEKDDSEEKKETSSQENEDDLEEEKDDSEEKKETSSQENKDNSEEKTEEKTEEPKNKLAFLKKLNFLKIDEDLSDEEKKQFKLKNIIIIVGSLLGIIILIAIILYFTGAFEAEVIEEPKDINITKVETTKAVTIKSIPRKKYITFNMSQIDEKRLNKKLSLLTKYEILEEDAIEKLKLKEKERLEKEQQAKLENFAKNNKEEPLFKKTNNNISNNQQVKLDPFIQIPTLKLSQFKSFIKRAKLIKANLSICKDKNGRTQVFIGPFLDNNSRKEILTTLSKKKIKDTKDLNLSKEEFEQRCSF